MADGPADREDDARRNGRSVRSAPSDRARTGRTQLIPGISDSLDAEQKVDEQALDSNGVAADGLYPNVEAAMLGLL